MQMNNPPPEGSSPFDALRALVSRQLEELQELAERQASEMTIADHERYGKALAALIKNSNELFKEAAARKSGEELKKEDDAIRAEFARRLAAMLRGRQMARAAGRDAAGAPSEVSS